MNFNDLIDKFNSGILTEQDINDFEINQYLEDYKPRLKPKDQEPNVKRKKDSRFKPSQKTISREYF